MYTIFHCCSKNSFSPMLSARCCRVILPIHVIWWLTVRVIFSIWHCNIRSACSIRSWSHRGINLWWQVFISHLWGRPLFSLSFMDLFVPGFTLSLRTACTSPILQTLVITLLTGFTLLLFRVPHTLRAPITLILFSPFSLTEVAAVADSSEDVYVSLLSPGQPRWHLQPALCWPLQRPL